MVTKVKNLIVVVFHLISDAFKNAMDDIIEDVLVLTSNNYLKSIRDAKNDYIIRKSQVS